MYENIPLTNLTKAEAKFNTSSSQSPIVYLDKDGNGTTDQEINPSVNQIPTPTPVILSAVSPIENNVLGTQTTSQNTLVGKQKEKFPLINSLIILTVAIVLVYVKLKQ